jgi:hypothetical protein
VGATVGGSIVGCSVGRFVGRSVGGVVVISYLEPTNKGWARSCIFSRAAGDCFGR